MRASNPAALASAPNNMSTSIAEAGLLLQRVGCRVILLQRLALLPRHLRRAVIEIPDFDAAEGVQRGELVFWFSGAGSQFGCRALDQIVSFHEGLGTREILPANRFPVLLRFDFFVFFVINEHPRSKLIL